MKLNLSLDVEIVDNFETNDTIARCFYPDDNEDKIQIIKGLNVIELSIAIHHEIGHIIDWYISNGYQSKNINIRENNANIIGDCIRYKQSIL